MQTESVVGTPGVWKGYVALCVAMALSQFAIVALGAWLLQNDSWLSRESHNPQGAFVPTAVLCIVSGVLFGIGNLALPFLPRRPWAYVLHLINIIAAMLTCILLIPGLLVLVAWFKPEAKQFFDFR